MQKAILRSQESCVDATSSDDKSDDLDLFIKGNPNCKYTLKLADFIHIPDIEANFSGYAALAYIPSSQSRSLILEVATAEWDIRRMLNARALRVGYKKNVECQSTKSRIKATLLEFSNLDRVPVQLTVTHSSTAYKIRE